MTNRVSKHYSIIICKAWSLEFSCSFRSAETRRGYLLATFCFRNINCNLSHKFTSAVIDYRVKHNESIRCPKSNFCLAESRCATWCKRSSNSPSSVNCRGSTTPGSHRPLQMACRWYSCWFNIVVVYLVS